MSALVEKKTGFEGSRTLIQGGFLRLVQSRIDFRAGHRWEISQRALEKQTARLGETASHVSDKRKLVPRHQLQLCPPGERLVERQFVRGFQSAASR